MMSEMGKACHDVKNHVILVLLGDANIDTGPRHGCGGDEWEEVGW